MQCGAHAKQCELRDGIMVVAPSYGFRFGGSGGFSRINVMVTRRFAGNVGSSGNNGWLSALPPTAKMWDDGSPSRSRIWRTTLARSADRSNAPYSPRAGTKPADVWPTMLTRSGVAFN